MLMSQLYSTRFIVYLAKTGPAQKLLVHFTGNSFLYRTRINVNGCYWNTCKPVFTATPTCAFIGRVM